MTIRPCSPCTATYDIENYAYPDLQLQTTFHPVSLLCRAASQSLFDDQNLVSPSIYRDATHLQGSHGVPVDLSNH